MQLLCPADILDSRGASGSIEYCDDKEEDTSLADRHRPRKLLRVEFVDEYQPDPAREARMIVVLPNGQRTTVSREDLVEPEHA